VVLAQTYEYRQPSAQQRAEAAEKTAGGTVTVDMTSRYLGLVVVPGQHIVKMEVEKFASQMRNTMANAI
jgi:N-alpha-acetyltransferase 38, NatC auxiliary subunit